MYSLEKWIALEELVYFDKGGVDEKPKGLKIHRMMSNPLHTHASLIVGNVEAWLGNLRQ